MPEPDGELSAQVILYYDGDCALCRMLAEFAERRAGQALGRRAWQELSEDTLRSLVGRTVPPDDIAVGQGDELWLGPDAWQWLLANCEGLGSLNWLAAKLGLERETAIWLGRGGHAMRSLLCPRCGRRR